MHSDWLRLRQMDPSQEILLGHAIFASSEYGYRRIARSISNNKIIITLLRRHVLSAENQHTSWRSLIHCCWTSRIEQSANPAARVGHHTRTILTSNHSASIWSLIAAVPSDSVYYALYINWLTYLFLFT